VLSIAERPAATTNLIELAAQA